MNADADADADAATEKEVRNNYYIPDDLALSILSKLPLKSLKRFGCIRKSWSLLFDDENNNNNNPHFMTMFRNNFISNHRSSYCDDDDTSLLLYKSPVFNPYRFDSSLYTLFGERYENRVKLDWPNLFRQDHLSFYILGSSSINGTLCLYALQKQVVLWNPATQEFKVLPPSSVESIPPYRDPSIRLHGYGYDQLRDDYKVIRHVHFYPFNDNDAGNHGLAWEDVLRELEEGNVSYDPVWEIYSLRSNSWRILDVVDMPSCDSSPVGSKLYMDGMCHWWGANLWGHRVSEIHNDEAYLVSFDLSKEVFFTTPIPFDIHLDTTNDGSFDFRLVQRHLVVLNGSIALISYYTNTFHISILGEIGVKESWTKLFVVGPLPCVGNLIGVGNKGVLFFRKKDDELAWFDLSTQIIGELGVKGDHLVSQIIIYKESLLPIRGISN